VIILITPPPPEASYLAEGFDIISIEEILSLNKVDKYV
jgi:hypothetical protein